MKNYLLIAAATICTLNMAVGAVSARSTNKPSPSDRMFIREAAFGGNDEIALSKIAIQRSSNPNIRKFARKMVVQHSAAGAQLTQIAEKLGVTPPSNVDPMHRKLARHLETLSGGAFNAAYLNAMVKDHTAADHVFQMGTTVTNDQLRNFAVQTLPVVEDHLKMATEMQQGISPKMAAM